MAAAHEPPTVLLALKVGASLRTDLESRYRVVGPPPTPSSDLVASLAPGDAERIRAVVTQGTTGLNREAIAKLPALGLVVALGSGYEGIDVSAALARRIVVGHSPGANAATVADHAMGLMIASVREIFAANAYLQRGEWVAHGRRRSGARGLTGRRVGIYGLGAIGEKIARRCLGFEMEVGYHNRRRRDDVPYPYFASLPDLAAWADVLMIAVRADAANRHSVNAEVLRALGPEGHVVNIARGFVIDEAALIEALSNRTIAGAGLDVFEHEPQVPAALRELPNVALTPHIAGDTREAFEACFRMVRANVDAYFAGEPIPTPVPESPPTFSR
jgi:lactate dehydrogenase-like 2-hydroxyacid dehydrogenase